MATSEPPKKPSNSYFLFYLDRVDQTMMMGAAKNGKISIGEAAKIISKEWKALSSEKKKEYEKRVADANKIYKKEKVIWEEKNAPPPGKQKSQKKKNQETERKAKKM